MKSSGNSSAPSPPSRRRFALTGPSRPFDPRTTAARADIADVRLAATIFAPHYAAPLPRTVVVAANVVAAKGGERITEVATGDVFEVLEVTDRCAWGVVAASGLVGYVPLAAFGAE